MKKIYLAAPLFNEMELQRNKDLLNYDLYLDTTKLNIGVVKNSRLKKL